MSFMKTYAQLRLYVKSVAREKARLKESDAFAYWFCQAAILHPDDENAIRAALCGNANDKNMDVISWSDISEEVYICQTKYRDRLAKSNETRNDVTVFAHVADAMAESSEKKMHDHFPKANKDVRLRLSKAWQLVHKHGYKLQLLYVSTGRFSENLVSEAESIVAASKSGAKILLYDGYDCCRIFLSFENLVPAIPFISIYGIKERLDPSAFDTGVKSTVFAAPVAQIKEIFDRHNERLFARNIRLDKGEKSQTNAEIADTLQKHPEHFFYMNNGITILGSDIRLSDEMTGAPELRISEPQIINGQQTTRTIGRMRVAPPNAEVLVKVICRRPESDKEIKQFRNFIYSVVRATNSQTKVNASELAANNPEQVEVERAFERVKWRYIRKSGKAERVETFDLPAMNGTVTLKSLATAIVVCEQDPQFIRREGIEALFHSGKQALYNKVFDERKRWHDYLICHLLLHLAKPKGRKAQKQVQQLASLGQYFVAYTMRQLLDPVYVKKTDALMGDLSLNLRGRQFPPNLHALRGHVAIAWQGFYRDCKERDDDPLSFVGGKASKEAWMKYWGSHACNKHRKDALKIVAALLADNP